MALLLASVGCGTDDASAGSPDQGTGLVFEVSPGEVQPGAPFQVTFPADTSVGVDLVLWRADEPLYVFHAHSGPDGPLGAEQVQDGMVITHPALVVSDGEPLIVEAELPDDVEPGPMRICSEDDCAEFEVIER